jgi:hypothetical protein
VTLWDERVAREATHEARIEAAFDEAEARALAVLIDATVIRGILLPAAMKLLGDWNWYLPRWLEWLPRIGAERDAGPPLEPEDVPEADDETLADEPRPAPAPA